MGGQEFSFEALEGPVQVDPGRALAHAEADVAMARAAAHEEGLRAGREEALAALAPALEALEQAAAAVQGAQLAQAERLETHAVDLALFLAERVLGGALAVQPERVVEAVRGALRGIVERERITVLVHPADLELVRDAMDGLRAGLGGIEHCVVEAERRVSRGGAVVRTPDGDVDARVETKLQRAREVVEESLAG
jgi:flagellar assembly protein FliH